MTKPYILCIDDQREILAALKKDLSGLEDYFQIDYCESTSEAKELLAQTDTNGVFTALIICDHVMPNQNGIDFLTELREDTRFARIPAILLTGLATYQDTINAINDAGIQAYIEKPWNKTELLKYAQKLYSRSIVNSGLDYRSFLPVLDQGILLNELHQQT